MAVVMTCLLGRGVGQDGAQNREIVGLGAAAGKHQFLGLAAEQSGHFPARGFQTLFRQLTVLVDAGGVAGHFK